MKRIVLKFKADGTVETEAEGFTGTSCIKETEKLLAGLKPTVTKRTLKPEYNLVQQENIINIRE